ncbi:MFS transporter [Pseudoteredinibacter isoporae]|uniref:Putative MFS family arabinose efflux permease n=1 Tax=Pseudoteredinibacter isoporae TaxID=570281 RepID=A0A7X0JRH1_9GAMM|nr:MFS transporter [Pseudoteredinibacter isoporae]MBB6520030.1 putative MFS family arabinose efflux permease [Pseudoteredinibacter isoporae]NHO85602.1 MFS transporter [Pseudoteredinibacter isoporae]NIB25946.1 MFS transporter [Pseudoteredinibacter isoporae]
MTINTNLNASADIDPDSPASRYAAIYFGVLGPAVFIVQPGFVQGLVSELTFSEAQAGYVASAEMWGIAIATFLLTFSARHLNWQRVLFFSVLLSTVGNLLSMFPDSSTSFAAIRFVTGLGSGAMISLSFTAIGLSRDPDRNFGFMIMWILIYGAIGFASMPWVLHELGLDALLVFWAILNVSGLAVLRFMPKSPTREHDSPSKTHALAWSAIAALFFYFLAQGVIWTYLFLIGTDGGVSEDDVAWGLTISQLLGIAGAFCAAMLANRYGRLIPLQLGILFSVAALLILLGDLTASLYAISVCLFNFAWNKTHPFMLALLADFDNAGRAVQLGVAAQMLGLAFAPALAATLLQGADYLSVIWLGVMLFVVSGLFILPPLLSQREWS